jgi:parallel beta-helix repeat protein
MTKVRTFKLVCVFIVFISPLLITETRATESIYVFPGDSIQEMVNSSFSGDTIFVKPGEYYESVRVDRDNLTIVALSNNPSDTFITGKDNNENVFEVIASNVTIRGFSIIGGKRGIYLNGAQNCRIKGNDISENKIGIYLFNSNKNALNENIIYSNLECGIKIASSEGNLIYRNYFNNMNNSREDKLNIWNSTDSGNYWSDYTGTDKNGDGIGDTAYFITSDIYSADHMPLMRFSPEKYALPEAIFTSNVTVGHAPLTVKFTDFSENASSLLWDFDNLQVANYSELLHTFVKEGVYTVNLSVSNEEGNDSTYVAINVLGAPDLSFPVLPETKFGSNVTDGYLPLTVQFMDFSKNADSLFWDFGDGKKSSCPAPMHTFCCPGNYTVSLTAENDNGTSMASILIVVLKPPEQPYNALPEAKFSASDIYGQSPLKVKFIDISDNANSWEWDFGDGNISSERNPEYTYTASGNYTVTLTVSNENGEDSKKVINLVQVESILNNSSENLGYPDADYTFSTEYAESSSSESKSKWQEIKRIISEENLRSIKEFIPSIVSRNSLTELMHPTGYETPMIIKDTEAIIKNATSKHQIKTILWIILLVEVVGISSIVSAIRKRRK